MQFQTANSFLVGIAQISSYSFFGALYGELWWYGLALVIGASVGNYLGKQYLKKISIRFFNQLVIAMMVISGILLLIKGLNL